MEMEGCKRVHEEKDRYREESSRVINMCKSGITTTTADTWDAIRRFSARKSAEYLVDNYHRSTTLRRFHNPCCRPWIQSITARLRKRPSPFLRILIRAMKEEQRPHKPTPQIPRWILPGYGVHGRSRDIIPLPYQSFYGTLPPMQ